MGLEAVKEDIISSMKEHLNSIIAEARKEANRIMKDAEKKIEDLKEKNEEEVMKANDLTKKKHLTEAELESRKIALDAKKQAIEKVFDEARKRLESLDEEKRESIARKLLEKAGKEIEICHVYCSKKDVKFVKGIKAENTAIMGGIIAENSEKTVRVDYSFETMLDSLKERELQHISRILFG